MRYVWISLRAVTISWVISISLLVYLARRVRRGRLDAQERERLRGAVFAGTLERLGAVPGALRTS